MQKSHQRCGVRGVCIYHIGPFKRKHRAYYTTRRLLFFIPVDSRRAAVLCVCSCACAGQCLLLFSPYSSAHAAAAAAEHARDELPVIVSSCTSNDTNFVFPAFNSDSAAVDSRLSRIFGLHIGDVVGEILYYYLWTATERPPGTSYQHRIYHGEVKTKIIMLTSFRRKVCFYLFLNVNAPLRLGQVSRYFADYSTLTPFDTHISNTL